MKASCMRVLSALVLAAACGGAPPAPPVMPPARVVSLAPSITEIVYALGAADRLVGVCAQCNYPEAAAQLPRVGGYLVPNVEAVVAARPDLVLVVPSPGNRDAVHAVERTGIRVVVVQDRTLEDLWTSMRTVAAALDLAERGEGLVTDVQRRLEAVRGRVAGLPPRRVLLVVGHTPLVVAGRGSLQDELVSAAGGVNVAADVGGVWPQISLELVVARARAARACGARGVLVPPPPRVPRRAVRRAAGAAGGGGRVGVGAGGAAARAAPRAAACGRPAVASGALHPCSARTSYGRDVT